MVDVVATSGAVEVVVVSGVVVVVGIPVLASESEIVAEFNWKPKACHREIERGGDGGTAASWQRDTC